MSTPGALPPPAHGGGAGVPAAGPAPAWCVVVPVKRLSVAKSRLAAAGGMADGPRRQLALAMARDVVTVALATRGVAAVVVVTDDGTAGAALATAGARVVADLPDAGLNPALEHGAALARTQLPRCAVAVLAADLPALSAAELSAALTAAARNRRCYVPDAAGGGTTLLTAVPDVPLRPAFGSDSARRHAAGGAVALSLPPDTGLRRDVDTIDDLAAAVALGVGPHTAAVLAVLPQR